MRRICLIVTLACSTSFPAGAQSPQIYSPNGQYLGNLNSNQHDPNSVANPYGRYGSQYSPDSINNPYGTYGSPYSQNSAANPYASPQNTPLIIAPQSGYQGYQGYQGYGN